jgi:hypothetical protein
MDTRSPNGHREGHGRTYLNKSLEELAEGKKIAEAEGQVVGLRIRFRLRERGSTIEIKESTSKARMKRNFSVKVNRIPNI